jgi:hypothetical protein
MESQTYFHLHATLYMFSLATSVKKEELDYFTFMNTITMGQTYLEKQEWPVSCISAPTGQTTHYICKCTHTPSPFKYSAILVNI